MEEGCIKCKITFNADKIIGCEGQCKGWFHLKCANIKEKEYSVISNCKGVKWYCEICDNDDEPVAMKVLENMNEAIMALKQEITELKNMLNLQVTPLRSDIYTNKLSYVEVMNHPAVIIQPKIDQQSKDTKKEVQQS
ncbi:hypothetical protein CBL_20899 [Carabus blaptoides fortunei]